MSGYRHLTTDRQLAELIAEHEADGWVVTRRRNGHLRWDKPGVPTVFTSSSPSDHRALPRIRRDLRRSLGHCPLDEQPRSS